MKISKLKPGDTLYDVHSYQMGNTVLRSVGVWTVKVLEVDLEGKWFTASWNSNFPEKHYSVPPAWRTKKPMLVRMPLGLGYRLATREEQRKAKEEIAQ